MGWNESDNYPPAWVFHNESTFSFNRCKFKDIVNKGGGVIGAWGGGSTLLQDTTFVNTDTGADLWSVGGHFYSDVSMPVQSAMATGVAPADYPVKYPLRLDLGPVLETSDVKSATENALLWLTASDSAFLDIQQARALITSMNHTL